MTWDDVGVVIRAVRGDRERWVADLLDRLAFRPGAVVSWHGEGRTVPESYADALAAWDGRGVRWVLQLEDDAILSPDFEAHALRLLRRADARPDVGLVSFYSGRRLRPGEAPPDPPTLEYLPGARFLMAQAIALRAGSVADHNGFLLRWTSERGRPYATDPATAAWLSARGLRYARAWPGIVQHRDVPSLYGHRRNPNRFSSSYDARYGTRSFLP
jgi:hypothetical protein